MFEPEELVESMLGYARIRSEEFDFDDGDDDMKKKKKKKKKKKEEEEEADDEKKKKKSLFAGVVRHFSDAVARAASSAMMGGKEGECKKRAAWSKVLQSLTQKYPGSLLPDRLLSTLRTHFDSFSLSYAQVGFEMEQVFQHVQMLEKLRCQGGDAGQIIVSVKDSSAFPSEMSRFSNARGSSCSYSCSEEDDDMSTTTTTTTSTTVEGAFEITFASKVPLSQASVAHGFKRAGMKVNQLHLYPDNRHNPTTVLGIANVCSSRELIHQSDILLRNILLLSAIDKLGSNHGLFGRRGTATTTNSTNTTSSKWNFLHRRETNRVADWKPPCSVIALLQGCLIDLDEFHFDNISSPPPFVPSKGVYKGKNVSVKALSGLDSHTSRLHCFAKSITCLASFRHKNVLPIQGILVDSLHSLLYVVADHYYGCSSLPDYIKSKGTFSLPEMILAAMGIVEGLIHLEKHGISLCGKLESAGIIFTPTKQWVMIDVLSCMQSVIYKGTEVKSVSTGSDVYNLGIILMEMITGQEVLHKNGHLSSLMTTLDCNNVDGIGFQVLPHWFAVLIRRCLADCLDDQPKLSEVLEILQEEEKSLLLTRVGGELLD